MADPQASPGAPAVSVLKQDGFGRVERVEAPGVVFARRVACGSRWPFSQLVARVLLRRERRALAALEGVAEVPRCLASDGLWTEGSRAGAALERTWVHGEPLHCASELPEDFFERLEELVERIHALGVCHNDLHKEPNIVVQPDGRPALIDFQLASVHASRRGRLFASRCRDDLRHVRKHARRYVLRGVESAESKARAGALPRRSFVSRFWRRAFKPVYEFATRRVLRLQPSEERRPSSGPWPRRTPPVGPLPRSF